MNMKQIGSRIKDLRRKKAITQFELADALGVSYQAVSNWERGTTPPDLENLIRLAEYFGVLVDSFLRADSEGVYLGIDGGGTKTEFVLVSPNGSVLKRVVKKGSNPNDIGFSRARDVIFDGIAEIGREFPPIKAVFCGIAGISTGNYVARLREEFKKNDPQMKVEITVDAVNLFGMDDEAEMAVISGTGSVVFVRSGEDYKRLGGWGYLFDSAGSAYDMGREAIRHALRVEDRNESPSILSRLVKEHLNAESIWEHLNVIYSEGRPYIASLATVVFDAYEAGDETAISIVDDSARALAQLLNDGCLLYGARPVAVASGGAFEHHRDILQAHISGYSDVRLKMISLPPVYGACRRARGLFGDDIPGEFYDNFKKSYGGGEA